MGIGCIASVMLAVLSVFEYPARQAAHERLRAEFIAALRAGDTEVMREMCEKGVALLPDDPTWHYNLACSLAYFKDQEKALDELEKAIDLGFRDTAAIAADKDLKRVAANPRFAELLEEADRLKGKPLLMGPGAARPATGIFGEPIAIGEQNLGWDFDIGCFDVKMSLAAASAGGNTGDLYMNRDGGHSMPVVTNWPGLTAVRLDSVARERGIGLDFPNMLFPYPVFGNCSRALTQGPYWRSLPRALMTTDRFRLRAMQRFYLDNQVWFFPAVDDFSEATNKFGDVFASVTPYWFATQGISWSDQYYLRAALEVSRSLSPAVKREIVKRGHLAPVIQALMRRNLRTCKEDEDYLTEKAHPTCFPPNGLDRERLKKAAASLKVSQIPPLASIAAVAPAIVEYNAPEQELSYATSFAWAFVLRAEAPERVFIVKAAAPAGSLFAFAAVHDSLGAAKLERIAPDAVKIILDKTRMTPTNRVDLAVFARSEKSSWGAPAFVSFAVVDPAAPYSDPVLTPLPPPEEETDPPPAHEQTE